ncbi:ABC transporter ATP-binding protein [Cohnella cholangitidis]|uniref:ABC transporter ATP-binding protein n=1 Tax=Cohnella cholangitidis TaxID=2598458 RepID=A0A7G5C2Y3_9BACL|nr:ABC transporter ATP-binding protein [Cohnella cholangitidis]QMV43567.1 ABC transporter ATP-binding protein [Cohnella cholangitidis]
MTRLPAVQADKLSKFFTHEGKSEQVLEDITFAIGEGEIVSVLGQSGCGKSTLLNVLGGFESAGTGTVTVGGNPVKRPSRKCVMLFQDYGLLPWRSVSGNVELGLEPLRLPPKEQRERALTYIRLVGLEDKSSSFPHQLSGGMRQRVALARALAMQPELLLMDEPFAALDTFTRYALQDELLRIQAQERVTIVLVTHDIDEAVYLSDRVFIMNSSPGRLNKEIRIDAAKPRDRGYGDFQHYRKMILEEFRYTGSGSEEEFTI